MLAVVTLPACGVLPMVMRETVMLVITCLILVQLILFPVGNKAIIPTEK